VSTLARSFDIYSKLKRKRSTHLSNTRID